jgi:hypothetical protein
LSFLDEAINFMVGLVMPKKQVGTPIMVEEKFKDLGDHKILKNTSPKGVNKERISIMN